MADWKSAIRAIAPVLGTALGGPLGGTALGALSQAILGEETADEAALSQAVAAGLSPDAMARLAESEHQFRIELERLSVDRQRLSNANEQAYLLDVQNARASHAQMQTVFRMGIAVICAFGAIVTLALIGAYAVMFHGFEVREAVLAAVLGFVGPVIGYFAAMSQQVVSFYFGSSAGSKAKTDALAASVRAIGDVRRS